MDFYFVSSSRPFCSRWLTLLKKFSFTEESNSGLSSGAVTGVVIGCIVFILIGIVVAFLTIRTRYVNSMFNCGDILSINQSIINTPINRSINQSSNQFLDQHVYYLIISWINQSNLRLTCASKFNQLFAAWLINHCLMSRMINYIDYSMCNKNMTTVRLKKFQIG